jgi:hypothetical protein
MATIVASVLRALGSTIAFVAFYYLLALDKSVAWVAVTILVAGLVLLVPLIVFQVRLILMSRFSRLP